MQNSQIYSTLFDSTEKDNRVNISFWIGKIIQLSFLLTEQMNYRHLAKNYWIAIQMNFTILFSIYSILDYLTI